MEKVYVNELSNEKQEELLKVIKNNLNKDGLKVDDNIILTSKIDDLNEHFTRKELEKIKGGK